MTENLTESTKELSICYNWFSEVFNNGLKDSSNDFLAGGMNCKLVSVAKNINPLFKEDSYFVTKIRLDAKNEIYIRCSDKAINAILEKGLGHSERFFEINQITELEAKLITAFNDNFYNHISQVFLKNVNSSRHSDILHLTFFILDKETRLGGKIILSFPAAIVSPERLDLSTENFTFEEFEKNHITANISVGTTRFTVKELKSLEVEDIVLLENSNIQQMTLKTSTFDSVFRVTPNPALILPMSNDMEGEEDMSTNVSSDNLWDSIQIELGAEFDKVKMSLGELKTIKEGLVVDIGSVYKNNISLKVEDKTVATGELVIINDRYGVKINKIFAEQEKPQVSAEDAQTAVAVPVEPENTEDIAPVEAPPQEEQFTPQEQEQDSDFDYSDFNLDDEDI